eukprot:TRINITY_DN202_c0_g1_i1.p1 TRINITY_DN202_c0_g1~~TRINITY_DN202_c0_g1_i1.p1  ORF type:complete len:625 (-),score=121.30 TRINITY_DN202_c0_g1_i1:943-2817(-)
MPLSSSQTPLPVLPPLRSVPVHDGQSSKQPVSGRSRARVGARRDVDSPKREASPPPSDSSSEESFYSSSDSSQLSSSSSSSAPVPSRSHSFSSDSNYPSSNPTSPARRSPSSQKQGVKPSASKLHKRSSIRKRQSPGGSSHKTTSYDAQKNKQRVNENSFHRNVPSPVRNQTCASAVEIVGRSGATIAQALEQLNVLSSIPRRRGRPSKSVIEQRNRLERLREQLDIDIERLRATNAKNARTVPGTTTTATTKTGRKSCKRPSGEMEKTEVPGENESGDRAAKRMKKTYSATKTSTRPIIESSPSCNAGDTVERFGKKRQREVNDIESLDTRKTKRLVTGSSAMLTTAGPSTPKTVVPSPRQRAVKAPKSSIRKQDAEKEKRDNADCEAGSDEENENEEFAFESSDDNEDTGDKDDEDDDDDDVDDQEGNGGNRKIKGEMCLDKEKSTKDEKDKKIESMQDELDELKDRLQKEIYRAAELEEALGLDIKAQVASAAEVQSMKSRIASLEREVKELQSTIDQNEDQVREKDAALRGLIAQVKDLEAKQCRKCGDKEGAEMVREKGEKTEPNVDAAQAKEEMEELRRYAEDVSTRMKRVLQVNRRLQQKMLRLRGGEVEDKDAYNA